MRSLLIVAAFLLLMTGGAYAIAPLVAPIPAGVTGAAECAVAAGSVPGTKIHSDISDDVGIIVDGANNLAYKSWWVNNPYVTTALPIVTGALGDTAQSMQEATNNGMGFTGWLTASWTKIKEWLAKDDNLTKYGSLQDSIGEYYTEGSITPIPVGSGISSIDGGTFMCYQALNAAADLITVADSQIPGKYMDCSDSPTPDDVTYKLVQGVGGTAPAKQILPGIQDGNYVITHCKGVPYGTAGTHVWRGKQYWTYKNSATGPILDHEKSPGVWNPAVDAAINDAAIAGNPDVKSDMCKVLADAPDVLDPVLVKLTASNLAQAVSQQGTDLLADNIASLAQQVAADPTNVEAQQALNDALAQQAAQAAQEMEKQAVIAADMPELTAVEKSVIDWTPLSNLIGASCSKIDKDDCPFPFDFIYSLGNTFDQFQSENPTMVDPSGSYGFDNFKINFNFDLSRFTETMAKIRLVLSWLMTIYTIHKCVRIVMRDNSAGDDD